MSPPVCPTPGPPPIGDFETAVDCDLNEPSIQVICDVVPGATVEVGVVLVNRGSNAHTIAAFQFWLENSDTALAQPIVVMTNNALDGNPDFEDASFVGDWGCAPPAPKPDNGAGAPGTSVSTIGCFSGASSTTTIPPGASLLIARVRYAIPETATRDSAFLRLSNVVIGDVFGHELGTCRPTITVATDCDGADLDVNPAESAPLPGRPEPNAPIATPDPSRRRALN
jgi:hypothetical protein